MTDIDMFYALKNLEHGIKVGIAGQAIKKTCGNQELNDNQINQLITALQAIHIRRFELIASMRHRDIMSDTISESARRQIRNIVKPHLTRDKTVNNMIISTCAMYLNLYVRFEIATGRYQNLELRETPAQILTRVLANNDKTRTLHESHDQAHARFVEMLRSMMMQTAHYENPAEISTEFYRHTAKIAIREEYPELFE